MDLTYRSEMTAEEFVQQVLQALGFNRDAKMRFEVRRREGGVWVPFSEEVDKVVVEVTRTIVEPSGDGLPAPGPLSGPPARAGQYI
jgi:hypothetical protein